MASQFISKDNSHIFQLISQGDNLRIVLEAITAWLESQIQDAIVSIMLYDKSNGVLNLVCGHEHFSPEYQEMLKEFPVQEQSGACGTAAFHKDMVISENLITDPKWKALRDILLTEKLTSCWSMPVISTGGDLYGTFATYYRTVRKPSNIEINLLERAAYLVSLAIDIDREREQKLLINEKYSSFFKYQPDAVFEVNLEGYIVSANVAFEKITGFLGNEIKGQYYCNFIPETSLETVKTAFEHSLKGESQHYELQAYHASGELLWLDITNLPIKYNKKIVGILVIAKNITAKNRYQERIRLLERAIQNSTHGVVIAHADSDMPIVYVNAAFLAMTGYTESEIVGRNCRFLKGPDTDASTLKKIKNALITKTQLQVKVKNYRKDGSWFWNQLTLAPILDDLGHCTHFLGIQQDVTKAWVNEEYIEYQKTHDYLTGLFNRRAFDEYLEKTLKNIQPQKDLYLLYIDLDDFSPLNETLGHIVGDKLLQSVATRMKNFIRDTDMLGRISGDEFAIILLDFKTPDHVTEFAERLLKNLSTPFQIDGHKIHITASIGIAKSCSQIYQGIHLIQHAILSMQEAKKQGRNTWSWYQEKYNDLPKIDYINLRLDLSEALEKAQLNVFYQPLIQPKTGEVASLEALIRWIHPEKGFIPPDVFIPLAERTGHIVSIGRWVLQQACHDIFKLNKTRERPLSVSVNISPLEFHRTNFLNDLEEILNVSQLPPQLLKLEVTEGMLITDVQKSIEILHAIRALGIKVSLDDFGTGYSSLSYLRRLPVDQIKLDKSFFENFPIDQQDTAIVKLIIEIAHQLNLEVVAEGIEIYEQVKFLTEYECDMIQGYFYSKPVPINQLKL
ncbi:bifunctional diguanylate cyclase/phosphodiesterase [Acinetobacter brisouii]|uniref:bifunctional diguanylate cyclase/phosphodiesterase n=1 Tax=Acinetobacter brisouii TaxID=396323 RepID=UPI0005F8580C|nr:EAL domain-containing protein [Acinetobacter brisouii]KJV38244.1 regulator [Acinetobacter brisouii]